MTSFQYTARTADGRKVDGVLQADSDAAAARTLDERGLFPVEIAPQTVARTGLRGRIKLRDVGVFYGQLGDLLAAGVPLLRSLAILSRVGLNKRLTELVARISESVSGGEPLADAMSQHPAVFTSLQTAMVRAGERGGFLEDVLINLAEFIDRQDELRSRVRGAMVYPMVLTGVGALVVLAVLVFLVPRFKPFFMNMELPVPTLILFAASDLLTTNLPLLAGLAFLAAVGVRAAWRSEAGRQTWDRWRMRLPVLGRVLRMVSVTRFCRILGTMLANGVPILQALDIGKDATGCAVMAASLDEAAENVRAGEPLAEPLKRNGMFPPEVVEMIAVGEESNQLERVLVQVADTVERRTSRQVDVAVRLLEPLILVGLAVMIAFVAVGLLYPMFVMSQALN